MTDPSAAGRFAPSPSGDLHLGNLRTALLAWLMARSTDRRFLIRMEDLDRVAVGAADRQLADLSALGIDWDAPVVAQSNRTSGYTAAIERLTADGLTYECFCTRREIREAASAPHPSGAAADLAYPGTCRDLSVAEREQRRQDRPAALRLRAGAGTWEVTDRFAGRFRAAVDDFVLRRNDGVAAYNLAVVVDDAAHGVDQIVRGDDLLTSAPRQAYLGALLGLSAPEYAHVPLALNGAGDRLAKRDGAVTLADLATLGLGAADVLGLLSESLGWPAGARTAADLLDAFDPTAIPRTPWVFDPAAITAVR